MEFEYLRCFCAWLYLHRNYVLILFTMCGFHCLPDTDLIKEEHESHEYLQNQNITGNSTEQWRSRSIVVTSIILNTKNKIAMRWCC